MIHKILNIKFLINHLT